MEEKSEKYKEILKSNGITDPVSEVVIKNAGLKGEGFASLTEYVTVKFEDGEKEPLYLFVKLQLDNPSRAQQMIDMKGFEKEATFLTEYLSEAREMCAGKGYPNLMDLYPKCYYGDEKMIVLENLVVGKGYGLKTMEQRDDLEYDIVAMKTIAKHHAIGNAMIAENGGPEKFFERFQSLDFEPFDKEFMINMMDGMFNNSVNSNIKILEKNCEVEGAEESAIKLRQFVGKPMSILIDTLKNPDDLDGPNFLVLCHGDYWNNNMMYLVDGPTNKPVHQVAIDFQVTRYNSPALDLSLYFFTSVQPQLRRTHLLELLTVYKNTLNKVSEDLEHPTNLTLDQIFKEFRKKVGYGFWFGFLSSVGPGVALFKDLDTSKDIKEWAGIMDGLVNKWIDENPEKGKETAEQLVKLIQEYEQLRL